MSEKLRKLIETEVKKHPLISSVKIINDEAFNETWIFRFKENMLQVPSALPAGVTSHPISEQAHIQEICNQFRGRTKLAPKQTPTIDFDFENASIEDYCKLLVEVYPGFKCYRSGRKHKLNLTFTYEFSIYEETINEAGDFKNDLNRMLTFSALCKNLESITPFQQLYDCSQKIIAFYYKYCR